MRIAKYIHSCLLVTEGNDTILFDPGKFSFIEGRVMPEQFSHVNTVIITHNHPDHVDVGMLRTIVAQSHATVFGNAATQAALSKEQISVTLLADGMQQTPNFTIRAIPAPHAAILADELPDNTAYVINDVFLNPGDSFAPALAALRGIKSAAIPSMAPWTTELAIADFAASLAPKSIIPVHDGYAKDFFLQQRYQNFTRHFTKQGATFEQLYNPGDYVDLD